MTGTVVRRRERGTSVAVAVTALAIFALGCGDGLLAPTESVQAPSALAVGVDPATGAKIETNKDDYPPGDTVRITGSGWAANEVVVLFVTEDPSMHPDWTFSATANGSGGFIHTGLVMDDLHLGVTFTLTATGQSSGSVAQTTFTDANSAIGTFSITPSPVEPEEDLTWSATATCTGPSSGPQSCSSNGSSVGGNVPAGYTIYLLRADGQCGTAGQSFSQVGTATTVGTTGTAGGTVAAPATPGSYAFRTSHPTEGNWGAVGQGTTPCVTIVVNAPPVADAGGPYSGNTGTNIALDGSGSSDTAPGTIVSYAWTIINNLTGGICAFVGGISNTVNPSVNCADDGSLKVVLTVTDNNGATDADTAAVTVTNPAPVNVPPTADAGGPYEDFTNTDITLDGSGSSDTAPGTIASYQWAILGGAPCSFVGGTNTGVSPEITCTNNGDFEVSLVVTDNDGAASNPDTADVKVNNRPPTADAGGPYEDFTNTAITLDGSGSSDSDGTIASYQWAILGGAPCSFVGGTSTGVSPQITCTNNGDFEVSLVVTDDDGAASDPDTADVKVNNRPPTADAGGPYSGDEGSNIALDGSGSTDSDGTIVSYQWAILGGAPCSFVGGTSTGVSPSVICTDNGAFSARLIATDDDAAADTATATVNVSNANPSVTINSPAAYSVWPITGFAGVVDFINASFTDAGTSDTHTCTINWGDGEATVSGTVSETAGTGTGTCKLTPAINPYTDLGDGAGIYTIRVTVTDDDAGSGYAEVTIVVYDPEAGFVTGGGWINSAAGAYKTDPSLAGKAHFGFVSKYLKGATKPTGNTEFQFQAGGLNFHSSSYEWLVVTQDGKNGQFKGVGTINGAGSYGFMLWATDGATDGSPDTFRIRIWSESGGVETDIYDNGFNQALASGSVVVHTGGKKK